MNYRDMCQVIANDWNREQEIAKNKGVKPIILSAEDIWNFYLVKTFPAIYIPRLYDAAKDGNLMGLLLTDNDCAKMFLQGIGKSKRRC